MSSLMDKLKKGQKQQVAAMKESAKSRGGYQKDERIWKYAGVDSKPTPKGVKQQYSESIIRILPVGLADMQRQEEGKLADHQVLAPIVSVHYNQFKKNGKFFRELNRREMLGEEYCPINEYDRANWAAWKEAGKPDDATKRTLVGRLPKTDFYCNILVEKDLANPENEGKVFLFKFGNAIMNIINEAIEPSMPGKESFDPFDFLEGRSLHLKFMMPEQTFGDWTGFAPKDIDKESVWLDPKPIAETEEEIERIMTEAYSLTEFTDLSNFKSIEEIEKRFYQVMGIDKPEGQQGAGVNANAGAGEDKSEAPRQEVHEKNTVTEDDKAPKQSVEGDSEDDDDFDAEFERMLAESGDN